MTEPREYRRRLVHVLKQCGYEAGQAAPEDDEIRGSLQAWLDKLGDISQCKGCSTAIYWIEHQNAKKVPYVASGDGLGLNHFADCPSATRFRKGPGPTLFDPVLGANLRDAGMARSYEAAPDAWKIDAWRVIVALANEMGAGALWAGTDQLRYRMAHLGIEMPKETRGLGHIMLAAAKAGWIETTGRRVKSSRASRHTGYVTEWRVA